MTFPSSPATAFYGMSFQPQTPDVEYNYGPPMEVSWSTITFVYDATILTLTNATYAPTFAVLNPISSRYADTTRVTLSYRGFLNGTLLISIADAKNFTLTPLFDDFSLVSQLFRLHCTQEFQSVATDCEPDGTLTDIFALPLPNPLVVTVVAPPSVLLVNGTLLSVANSVAQKSVLFAVASCDGYAPSFEAPLVVNLAPAAYDIDIGLEGPQLALGTGELQMHINTGVSGIDAFFIELSLAAANCSLAGACAGPIACMTDDPYGLVPLVQIAGVGQSPPGVIGLVCIIAAEVDGVSIGARVKTIGLEQLRFPRRPRASAPGSRCLPSTSRCWWTWPTRGTSRRWRRA